MTSPIPPELRWLFPKVKPQLPLHAASFVCLTLASLLALVTPLSIRWLIDSILPAHDPHLLIIAIGLIFASFEGKAILNAFGGYLTFRATQHTALALRVSLLGLFRPDSRRRIVVSVRRTNRRNLVLRFGPLTLNPPHGDRCGSDSIGHGGPEPASYSHSDPDRSRVFGRPPSLQEQDRTSGRPRSSCTEQIQQFPSGTSFSLDADPTSATYGTAGA